VQKWASDDTVNSKPIYEPYCQLNEFEGKNSCQEFIVYTLAEAVGDLEKRLGDSTTWQYKNLMTTRFLHQPFSEIPYLRDSYEVIYPQEGSFRTINLAYA
jgi:hypothetical protein